ncbi:hypothetical protein [Enterobacter hormaechei]|uniref:hypothetical protein n=1 Tax=Enterobacter hormaechei TaxID=158836 RepID=UPI0039C2C7EF
MKKTTINGYNYEIIGDVMTVQEEREVVFKYYPTTPTDSLPIMKHYIIDDLIKMTDDELHEHSLTDDTILNAVELAKEHYHKV